MKVQLSFVATTPGGLAGLAAGAQLRLQAEVPFTPVPGMQFDLDILGLSDDLIVAVVTEVTWISTLEIMGVELRIPSAQFDTAMNPEDHASVAIIAHQHAIRCGWNPTSDAVPHLTGALTGEVLEAPPPPSDRATPGGLDRGHWGSAMPEVEGYLLDPAALRDATAPWGLSIRKARAHVGDVDADGDRRVALAMHVDSRSDIIRTKSWTWSLRVHADGLVTDERPVYINGEDWQHDGDDCTLFVDQSWWHTLEDPIDRISLHLPRRPGDDPLLTPSDVQLNQLDLPGSILTTLRDADFWTVGDLLARPARARIILAPQQHRLLSSSVELHGFDASPLRAP